MDTTMDPRLNIVASGTAFQSVTLTEPSPSGYILLAAEVDRRPPFLGASAAKRRLIRDSKALCARLAADATVLSATVFRAVLAPPGGRSEFLKRRAGQVHIARFDLVILIETESLAAAQRLQSDATFKALEARVQRTARYTHAMTATNVRRIGPVDHEHDGIYLFNYFFADDTAQNLGVWAYTAGWFQQETGLDNSTVLLPTPESASRYTIVNHCRWDRLADVLPALLFKRSFRSFVLRNFEGNNVAPMPILYRLA